MLTHRFCRASFLLSLTLLLSGCDRMERAPAYQDGLALGADTARPHLLSRSMGEAISDETYPTKLQKMADDGLAVDADPKQVQLVLDVTARLVDVAEKIYPYSKQWQWDVHVVTTDEVNAWCMAGGKMAVYTGLLNAVQHHPDRLAAVMGHEIAHALLEHGRKGMGRDLMLSSGLWIASKSLKIGAQRSDQIAEDLRLAFQPFQREQEREADQLGMELLARAGFDVDIGSRIWQDMGRRIDNAGARRLVSFYASHPLDDERLAHMAQVAAQIKQVGIKP